MKLMHCHLSEINYQSSAFFFDEPKKDALSRHSFPILVIDTAESDFLGDEKEPVNSEKKYQLLFGKEHCLSYEKDAGDSLTVLILIFPKDSQLIDVLDFIYTETFLSEATAIQKLRFIAFCRSHHLSKQECQSRYFKRLGLPLHQAAFVECQKILNTSLALQHYMSEKKLSFKQCLLLSLISSDITESILALSDTLALSSSHFLSIAEDLHDLKRRDNLSVSAFLSSETIKVILDSEASPHQKTAQLKSQLQALARPIWTQENQRIQEKVQSLDLKKTRITWDYSLENKGLQVHSLCQNSEDIQSIVDELLVLKDSATFKDLLSG